MRQIQERLRALQVDALRDRAELSQIRERLFMLRLKEGQPEEAPETEIEFPCQTKPPDCGLWRG